MELIKLLRRQLNRLALSEDQLPLEIEKWQRFIEIIHSTYNEHDQERYLNERSTLISSRELTTLNKKLQTAQHISRLGNWEYDGKTKVLQLSREVLRLFEPVKLTSITTLDELLKSLHENDRKRFSDVIQKALSEKGDYDCEFRLANPEGLYPWFYMVVRSTGTSNNLSGVMIDITKRKYAEEEIKSLQHQLSERADQLSKKNTELKTAMGELHKVQKDFIRNEKLTIFSQLSAGIVSLINKPLNAILTKEGGTMTPESRNDLLQMKVIIDHLSIFSGNGFDDADDVDVNAVIESCIQTIERDFKHVSINKKFSPLPTIHFSAKQLELILTNVLLNAVQAISTKGVINITSSVMDAMIVMVIEDSGCGISPQDLTHIFTPFFTTKQSAMGLGLATAYGILQTYGGRMTVKSELKRGSVFTIYLPKAKVT